MSFLSMHKFKPLKQIMCIFYLLSCLTLSACSGSSNEPMVRYQKIMDGYEIRLAGQREKMSHDLINSLFPHTYAVEEILIVPRLQGIVYGSEIPAKKGNYKYAGVIRFNGETMVIDLRYVDTDQKIERNISWNGTYKLVPFN